MCLSAVAYATTPPRTVADAPGTETSAETTSPPVSDSATATVHPRAISRLTSASADDPTVGTVAWASASVTRCSARGAPLAPR